MDASFHITRAGYNVTENIGFVRDSPRGSEDYMFIIFLNDALVKTTGTQTIVRAGGCMLLTPGAPHCYSALSSSEFRNSYIHFDCESFDVLNQGFGLPLNQVFYPGVVPMLQLLIKELQHQVNFHDEFWQIESTGIMLQLLSRMARACSQTRDFCYDATKVHMYQNFKLIRNRILKESSTRWTLKDMARLSSMCVSGFCAYYREFFHTTPIADLIAARIDRACYLLAYEDHTVREVAEMVGYSNIFHFTRQFRASAGCTPGKYAAEHSRLNPPSGKHTHKDFIFER